MSKILVVGAIGALGVLSYRQIFGRFPWEAAALRPIQLPPRPAPTVRLAENHMRGQALTPQTWFALAHGSVLPTELSGTFDGSAGAGLYLDSQLLSPEKRHVTPQIEAALAQSAHRRTWFGGGQTPPVQGTFG